MIVESIFVVGALGLLSYMLFMLKRAFNNIVSGGRRKLWRVISIFMAVLIITAGVNHFEQFLDGHFDTFAICWSILFCAYFLNYQRRYHDTKYLRIDGYEIEDAEDFDQASLFNDLLAAENGIVVWENIKMTLVCFEKCVDVFNNIEIDIELLADVDLPFHRHPMLERLYYGGSGEISVTVERKTYDLTKQAVVIPPYHRHNFKGTKGSKLKAKLST